MHAASFALEAKQRKTRRVPIKQHIEGVQKEASSKTLPVIPEVEDSPSIVVEATTSNHILQNEQTVEDEFEETFEGSAHSERSVRQLRRPTILQGSGSWAIPSNVIKLQKTYTPRTGSKDSL